ncbi:DUF6531 domain-containing protein [Streptomyces sp. NBC_01808]|uniref:DUF6531 domain-containing protein n=1 Tax=Streptomyces sp. NBC_01808 TaxID=2975947 RepID=UPI002DDA800E|nr:DUF6531 domain-containing protein [Streptomyces sp. NBC_01808]WSA39264.1 DUF6531 domain-containing protein [Streptomyces sp. NBC_01808]
MGNRPTDWHILDLDEDPVPGDPERVKRLARELHDFADDVADALRQIKGMAGEDALLRWAGKTAKAFQDEFEEVPKNLKKLQRSYDLAGDALAAYWPKLERAQSLADKALAKGREAQSDLTAANGRLDSANSWVDRATKKTEEYDEKEGKEKPDESEVRAATRNATDAKSAQSSAQTAVDNAESGLEAAKKMAADAKKMREDAASEAKDKLEEASDAGIQNRKWWEKAVDWVKDNWDTIVNVCKVIVAVLGIVVLIIGGPLAWVVLAAALVVLADTLYKYMNGQASLWDVAFAALDCIPGMKGITSLAKLGKMAGGLKAVAKGGLKAMSAGVKGMGKAFRKQAVQMFKRNGCGDPVDVATGEMTLSATDVELPGVLPLVIERHHITTYTDGRYFGSSWVSTLDQRLTLTDDAVHLLTADGMTLVYPTPLADGETAVFPVAGPRWGLTWDGRPGAPLVVEQPEAGRVLLFAPVPGRPGGELPISAVIDRNGNRVDFRYRDDGELRELAHSGGYRVGVAVYERRVTSLRLLSDPAEPVLLAYDYDDNGLVEKVFNSSGLPLLFSYDEEARLTRWEDRNGTWYRYEYDDAGRCVFSTGTDRALEYSYRYEPEHLRTTATDSRGHSTVYEFNDGFQLVAQTDAHGRTIRHEYDLDERLSAYIDPLGRTTRYAYDTTGDLATLVLPDGSRKQAVYNELRLPVELVEADGSRWEFAYDARGNRVATLDPAGRRSRFSYDEHGGLTSVTDAAGGQTRVRCDAAGLPIAVTDPVGETTTLTRDAFGRPVTLTDPLGACTRSRWSVEGRLLERTDPLGGAETLEWDPEGNLLARREAGGATTTYTYGAFDQMTSTTYPDGAAYRYTRDAELNLLQVTDPAGRTWDYDYDEAGRLVSESDFDGRVTRYTYDAADQIRTRTNAVGQRLSHDYDLLGRVTATTSEQGISRYEYDALGRVTRAATPGVDLARTYDPLGNLLTETTNGRTLAFTYDAADRQVTRTTPSGHHSEWTYTPDGLAATLTTDGRTLTFDHDPLGRETARRVGDRLTCTQQWDRAGRLTRQTVDGPTARAAAVRRYRYRADGHLTALDDGLAGVRTYDLDALGRVLAAAGTAGATSRETYVYDATGNQTEAHWPTAGDPPGADAAGDREFQGTLLTRAGRVRYEYDAAGRIVLRQRRRLSKKPETWHYTWDADSRLTLAVTPDGTTWRYRYDGFGRRVAKERLDATGAAAERTDFTWDGSTLVEQATTGGSSAAPVTLTWNHRELQPLTQTRHTPGQNEIDREFYAIVTDLVGTPTELVDEDGATAWRQRSTLWGLPLATSGDDDEMPLRFPGQYADTETGWHYNVLRHYDPATGRYATLDPLGLTPAPNPYTYPHNPTTWTDPLGLAAHSPPAGNGGKGRKKGLRPDPNATGPHTTFRRDASTGRVVHYAEWAPQSNPKNPAPWEMVKRADMQGQPHFDKTTGQVIPTPHINLPDGSARPAEPWEITPGGNP